MKTKPTLPVPSSEALASQPLPVDGAAISRPQFPLTAIPQHERFLAERALRAENAKNIGAAGHCLSCGKPHPKNLSGYRCRDCKRNGVRPPSWGSEEIPKIQHGGNGTTGKLPDLDGVVRYTMSDGTLEIRADRAAVFIPRPA